MLVAALKLIHPARSGIVEFPSSEQRARYSLRLGFGSVPATGRDLLGWWIVPIGWIGGGALVMLTTYIAIWFVRQYRKSLSLPKS